ncbi:MAG: hypothetical protein BMS9Abin37_1171 [Acidobacteriota bacterium]|nr:MAG: hypothetical protein BMS9Abin37_1171 [Acidobacteriota bacterium]
MDAALRKQVRDRAGDRCEYCRIHQDEDAFFSFPVDHIIARQHGGQTDADNLCLSCYRCNSHKGPNIASIDPATETMVRLFHPRRDDWGDHFEWRGALLLGRTPIGRATVKLLSINHPDYALLRESLIDEGSFPNPETHES